MLKLGRFMLWRVGSSADTPDGQGALERGYGPSTGKGNFARFKMAEFDRLYDELKMLPSGPARQALFDRATQLMTAFVPYRIGIHRIVTDLGYPAVSGYRRPAFWADWWQYVDIDAVASTKASA